MIVRDVDISQNVSSDFLLFFSSSQSYLMFIILKNLIIKFYSFLGRKNQIKCLFFNLHWSLATFRVGVLVLVWVCVWLAVLVIVLVAVCVGVWVGVTSAVADGVTVWVGVCVLVCVLVFVGNF